MLKKKKKASDDRTAESIAAVRRLEIQQWVTLRLFFFFKP